MTRLAPVFALFACAAVTFGYRPPQSPLRAHIEGVPSGPMNEIVPGQVRIKFTPEDAARMAAARPIGNVAHTVLSGGATGIEDLTYVSRIANTGWTLWFAPSGTNTTKLAASLRTTKGVVYAEPVHRVYPLLSVPNDTDFNVQESSQTYILDPLDLLNGFTFRRLWHLDDTNAWNGWSAWPNTWYTASTIPANRPTIAFIDSGIDPNHPDFINTNGTSTSITGGGQIDYTRSASVSLGVVYPGTDVTDEVGHGTHVAGLALAAGNNGGVSYYGADDGLGDGGVTYGTDGVIGIGYNCQGIILKVVGANGSGTDTDAAAAMFYAADAGADIISASVGDTAYSQVFQDAVTYAFQKGSLVVCAGNELANQSGTGIGNIGPIYPAACSGALAVEAEGPGQTPALDWYAGAGNYVDIAAPGGDVATDNPQSPSYLIIQYIFSTTPEYTGTYLYNLSVAGQLYPPFYVYYAYSAGTSMATPQVSGAAGLYYGMMGYRQSQGYVNMQAYRALEASADDTMGAAYGGWEPVMGYGGLDIGQLMTGTTSRSAQVGSIKGIVYSNGSFLGGVVVKAKNVNGTGITYSTSTSVGDGTYRFDFLPPATYNVTTAPGGNTKTKVAIVKAGSDQGGFDFWCGSYTGDTTPPVVPFFNVTNSTASTFTLHQWGYDTETGIDSIYIQVGTTPGGNDVMASTLLVPDTNTSTFGGVSLLPGVTYYVTGTYTNGNGPSTGPMNTTVVNATFSFGTSSAPTSYTVFRGIAVSGNLASLLAADTNYLVVRKGITLNPNEAPITVYVNGTAPSQSASAVGVSVVAHANTVGLTQGIDLYDYTTNSWVSVDTRAASSGSDSTVSAFGTNPNRFIQSGTRAVKMRLTYRQTGITLLSNWQSYTNQVKFLFGP